MAVAVGAADVDVAVPVEESVGATAVDVAVPVEEAGSELEDDEGRGRTATSTFGSVEVALSSLLK